ncbi:fasciclin domain-containing protein [Methanoculleus sp. Wushi-C6]|uniref:Fasciclin domain-containing protein n=1 Tax=Methanoculleus caldifontis TaxID=2651577 RepID=A0ABU3X445_9EURY|nr:fasciclin domain-containing protein [Methanoculleus sp. Wushi-C6]MDV2482818.1 fasciclin domain-containing protein [Methanoculleus sp. Wushi-C6]
MQATHALILALAVAATVLACGCTSPVVDPTANQTNETLTVESLPIAGVLDREGNFTTFLQAFEAAGLVGTIEGPGPYTVFAPTDEAFEQFPDAVMEGLFNDPKGALAEIALYHMVPGRHTASEIAANRTIATVQGNRAPVEADGDEVTVGGAAVVRTDIPAANGVIHVIDAVMIPPDVTLPPEPEENGTG